MKYKSSSLTKEFKCCQAWTVTDIYIKIPHTVDTDLSTNADTGWSKESVNFNMSLSDLKMPKKNIYLQ